MCKFLQCWFLKRYPWNKTALLNFHARFAGCWKRKWQILEYEGQLSDLLFWKTKIKMLELRAETIRGHPLHHSYPPNLAAIRPAISNFELFKSSSLKRGMDASLFFCVVRHGRNILSWWNVVFQLQSNSWNVYIHFPLDWWWDISTRQSNAKSYNAKSTTSNSFVPPSADCRIFNDWKLVGLLEIT